MNDRERLIELLDDYYSEEGAIVRYFTEKDCKKIADYLLKNGVIVLPCKVGDTVYELKYYHCCTNPELDFCDIDEIESDVEDIPAADVRPERHGRWEAAGNIVVECSACGEVYSAIMIPRYYCPNCGAKMDREESDLNGKINIS